MPKRSRTTTAREVSCPAQPDWKPLEQAAVRWVCGGFMAMGEAVLKNGARVRCYKHADTRRSLHLTDDGEAYLYSYDPRHPGRSGRYERVSLEEALGRVILLPQFEDGWVEGERSSRPAALDEEGNEIDDDNQQDFIRSGFMRRLIEDRWETLNAEFWPPAS